MFLELWKDSQPIIRRGQVALYCLENGSWFPADRQIMIL